MHKTFCKATLGRHLNFSIRSRSGILCWIFGYIDVPASLWRTKTIFDDMESRRLKREALEAMDVKYDPNKIIGDETNNKKRKRHKTQLESDVLSTLKNIKISVHTRRDLSVNEDIREYIVKSRNQKGRKLEKQFYDKFKI